MRCFSCDEYFDYLKEGELESSRICHDCRGEGELDDQEKKALRLARDWAGLAPEEPDWELDYHMRRHAADTEGE